jgi:hypothetical protein
VRATRLLAKIGDCRATEILGEHLIAKSALPRLP